MRLAGAYIDKSSAFMPLDTMVAYPIGMDNSNPSRLPAARVQYGAVSPPKKKRRVWSKELHHRFKQAVKEVGLSNAVPTVLLKLMENQGVNGLSREQIASHLQKYRNDLHKKKSFKFAALTSAAQPTESQQSDGPTSSVVPSTAPRKAGGLCRGGDAGLSDDDQDTDDDLDSDDPEIETQRLGACVQATRLAMVAASFARPKQSKSLETKSCRDMDQQGATSAPLTSGIVVQHASDVNGSSTQPLSTPMNGAAVTPGGERGRLHLAQLLAPQAPLAGVAPTVMFLQPSDSGGRAPPASLREPQEGTAGSARSCGSAVARLSSPGMGAACRPAQGVVDLTPVWAMDAGASCSSPHAGTVETSGAPGNPQGEPNGAMSGPPIRMSRSSSVSSSCDASVLYAQRPPAPSQPPPSCPPPPYPGHPVAWGGYPPPPQVPTTYPGPWASGQCGETMPAAMNKGTPALPPLQPYGPCGWPLPPLLPGHNPTALHPGVYPRPATPPPPGGSLWPPYAAEMPTWHTWGTAGMRPLSSAPPGRLPAPPPPAVPAAHHAPTFLPPGGPAMDAATAGGEEAPAHEGKPPGGPPPGWPAVQAGSRLTAAPAASDQVSGATAGMTYAPALVSMPGSLASRSVQGPASSTATGASPTLGSASQLSLVSSDRGSVASSAASTATSGAAVPPMGHLVPPGMPCTTSGTQCWDPGCRMETVGGGYPAASGGIIPPPGPYPMPGPPPTYLPSVHDARSLMGYWPPPYYPYPSYTYDHIAKHYTGGSGPDWHARPAAPGLTAGPPVSPWDPAAGYVPGYASYGVPPPVMPGGVAPPGAGERAEAAV
eukprot:jgi/Mesvir1/15238/Mv06463-RA.1